MYLLAVNIVARLLLSNCKKYNNSTSMECCKGRIIVSVEEKRQPLVKVNRSLFSCVKRKMVYDPNAQEMKVYKSSKIS